ncbi:unnamed protein product, partial [Symbiodinium microadriaticum]
LGGLTSCYAASAMPAQYQRAFCMSPSVWWNAGEMAALISANYQATKIRPLSVVVEVGTQEGPSIITSNFDQQEWIVYIEDMMQAWRDIGVGDTEPFGIAPYPSTTNLIYYTIAGGVHNLISWVDMMNYGMPLLFQTSYPQDNLLQRNARTVWEYPEIESADDNKNCDERDHMLLLLVGAGALVVFLLPANVYMVYGRYRTNCDRGTGNEIGKVLL